MMETSIEILRRAHRENAVKTLLITLGEDVDREGLKDTPARVARAWGEWTSGYGQDVAEVLKGHHGGSFADGAERYDEMIVVRGIAFYSHCEHHLAPFFGSADIGYIPQENGRVVGLSKLSRLLDVFARRLQVQERLTVQVADAIMEHLQPKGAGVVIHARHLCMESRGICKQGHSTTTSALRGVFRDPAPRAEFMGV
jgi:GTP cyclohydrolase I